MGKIESIAMGLTFALRAGVDGTALPSLPTSDSTAHNAAERAAAFALLSAKPQLISIAQGSNVAQVLYARAALNYLPLALQVLED